MIAIVCQFHVFKQQPSINYIYELVGWQCGSSDVKWPRLESPPFSHVSAECKGSGWQLAGLIWNGAVLSGSHHPADMLRLVSRMVRQDPYVHMLFGDLVSVQG